MSTQNIENIVEAIAKKCDKIINQNRVLSKENKQLKFLINKHQALINQQKETIKQLEEKINIIKIAKTLTETGETSLDIKLKINEIVKEIDRCVAILNR